MNNSFNPKLLYPEPLNFKTESEQASPPENFSQNPFDPNFQNFADSNPQNNQSQNTQNQSANTSKSPFQNVFQNVNMESMMKILGNGNADLSTLLNSGMFGQNQMVKTLAKSISPKTKTQKSPPITFEEL